MMTFFFLFTMGLSGSIHCVGMCGPLMTIAYYKNSSLSLHLLLYHFMRIISYAMIGLMVGSISEVFYIYQIQSWMALIMGLVLLTYVITSRLSTTSNGNIAGYINKQFILLYNKYLSSHSYKNTAISGILNGFLPCGLVYAAMAMAFSNRGAIDGVIGMALFGLGTLPLLLIIFTNNTISKKIKKYSGIQNIGMTLAAIILILRSVLTIIPSEASLWSFSQHATFCFK
jgi:uncharacterized protein